MRVLLFAAFVLAASSIQSQAEIGGMCGGFIGAQCAENEWCSYSADNVCGIADGTGVCKPRPTACTMEFMPVCGCDGVTHPNACRAHAEGVSVAYVGKCTAGDDVSEKPGQGISTKSSRGICPQVISCGTKDGVRKEYPTPCAAAADGATNISEKTGASCEVTQ